MESAITEKYDYPGAFHLGGEFAELVAQMLRDRGADCNATPVQIATSSEERKHMTKHEQDITFPWSSMCIEVKSTSCSFSADVSKYPFRSLFVDTVSGFDAKAIKPIAYVIISQKTHEVVCISHKSKDSWKKVSAYDRKQKLNDVFYSAPKSALIPFGELVDWLLDKQKKARATHIVE